MKKITLTAFILSFLFGAKAQPFTEKDLAGCWEIKEVRIEDKEQVLNVNDLNGPGIFITCFMPGGKFVSKVEDDGKTRELGTGSYSILKDGKTLQQSRDLTDDSEYGEDVDGEIVSIESGIMLLKSGNTTMKMQKRN